MLIIAHLLELAGLYDEPFFITNEYSVEVVLEERDEKLRGRIDTLVFQRQFWSAVVESKKSISFEAGIPQANVGNNINYGSSLDVSQYCSDKL